MKTNICVSEDGKYIDLKQTHFVFVEIVTQMINLTTLERYFKSAFW